MAAYGPSAGGAELGYSSFCFIEELPCPEDLFLHEVPPLIARLLSGVISMVPGGQNKIIFRISNDFTTPIICFTQHAQVLGKNQTFCSDAIFISPAGVATALARTENLPPFSNPDPREQEYLKSALRELEFHLRFPPNLTL
nr:hypothetical protein Iba_chr05aCG1190 [Ipomoea batatas]